ncbi:hypothetical protein G7Z17_g1578 [Cylindrodendrum hubeiense]|uniref:SRP9 domain-containing protein n=1 Tax=Cylindrodendrum hubeiense TaxID=595255 RepID=A0A9P5HJ81_9HYPO|nr:hypothetical protein G7Z17_g1578 [Cylindrodendrum hubeiense]
MENRELNVPSGAGQQAVDEGGIQRRALELLDKRGLVERDTGGERLGNDTLTFGDELGGQSGRRGDRVSTSILNRQNKSGASRGKERAQQGGGRWGGDSTKQHGKAEQAKSKPERPGRAGYGCGVAWARRQPPALAQARSGAAAAGPTTKNFGGDPVSGATLKYRTTKAAEVSRLIGASLGRLGRSMAAVPEPAEEPMLDAPDADDQKSAAPASQPPQQQQPQQAGGGGKKKKKGKK